jgi:predicted nucleotidyltransferase component of viral defense system
LIAKDYITEWREHAPWVTDAQVEQDLVISRAIIEIFRDENVGSRLAFRGGTALFKLHLRPVARYSEDIDLVQIAPAPIVDVFDAIRSVLDPWLGHPRRQIKEGSVNLVYRFTSEDEPPKAMRLKIEINSREHFAELGHIRTPFEMRSRWWSGAANVTTFTLEELLGTKLRALYQRRKGRDLFDLWYGITHGGASSDAIVACFSRYMRETAREIPRALFEENLAKKLTDDLFRADMSPLLRPGIAWDLERGAEVVRGQLLAKLPGDPWSKVSEK